MVNVVAAVLALGVEIAMLWAYGRWGYDRFPDLPLRVAGAAVAVAAVAIIWGAFLAPRARRRLPLPARIPAKLALFAGSTAMAWSGGHLLFAATLAICAIAALALEYFADAPSAAL
ncbi:YrdB family protein [Bradyrhizobium sp. 2TAF24]|uniref:YrdB family protein n=1 Tax=Bradyrhizobium sp. 2TAF24 TaxID=3233011 RepID=UPI003F8F3AD9